jgi:hypothetical protein
MAASGAILLLSTMRNKSRPGPSSGRSELLRENQHPIVDADGNRPESAAK